MTGGLRHAVDQPAGGDRSASRIALSVLVFLFPVVVATTNGGGSYVYVLLLAAGLVRGWDWRGLERRDIVLLAGLGAALCAMALGLFNTVDVRLGLARLERYVRIASIAPIYLLFRRGGFPLHRPLGAGAILATVVMAGQAWYQVRHLGQDRAAGAYHHLVFGDLAVLWGCLGVLFALIVLRGRASWLAAAATAAAAAYASTLSLARGAWLFAPVFLAVLVWMLRSHGPAGRALRRGIAAVVVSGVAVGLWQREPIVDRVRLAASELREVGEDPAAETSLGIRVHLWRASLLLAREHPVVGAGLGDFQHHVREMVRDGRSPSPWVAHYAHAHSIYLDALANAGLVGLLGTVIGYLMLPLWTFAGAASTARSAGGRYCAMGGIVTVLAFATFGLSEALWTRNPFVNTYVVCIAVFLAGLSWDTSNR
jgi:O-antigen ligase